MSLVEAVANVVMGYGVAVGVQIITVRQNLVIGLVFTAVSVHGGIGCEGYLLRRIFESVR